mgnify:CR=1 FL=1
MPLRVGSINNTLFYTADFLYEDLYTSSRGRCIMEFKHDIISCFFLQWELYAVCHIVIVGIAWLLYLENDLEK